MKPGAAFVNIGRGQVIARPHPFPLRAEQVSRLIWVIIGAGLALLFTAIVVRLVRRIMRSRATTPDPADDAAAPQDGEEPAAPATEPTSGTRG